MITSHAEGNERMKKHKTYMDELMRDRNFKEKFDVEYQNLCVAEQIISARHHAHLTQSALAKRINTTKSAISRYESADYTQYGIPLLARIAKACGAKLKIVFTISGHSKNNSRCAAT